MMNVGLSVCVNVPNGCLNSQICNDLNALPVGEAVAETDTVVVVKEDGTCGRAPLSSEGLRFIAIINQNGEDVPSQTVVFNSLGLTGTWTRADEGEYEFTFTNFKLPAATSFARISPGVIDDDPAPRVACAMLYDGDPAGKVRITATTDSMLWQAVLEIVTYGTPVAIP